MKNSRTKILSIMVIFTIIMALFLPSVVRAAEIGTVGGHKVTFTETGTDSEQVDSSVDMEEYINEKEGLFMAQLTFSLDDTNINPLALFSRTEPYKYLKINNIESGYQMINGTLTQTYEVQFTTYTVTKAEAESNIIRKTTTIYHTKIEGALSVTGDQTYSKNYSSGDSYIDGNYDDEAVANLINEYKNDMNTIASSYGTTATISEGVSSYYYEVHDEITQEGNQPGSDVIFVGDIDDFDPSYSAQGKIVINTILDKYQTYTITGTANCVATNEDSESETTDLINEEEDTTSSNPATGDSIALWISLMVISILGIGGIVVYIKKN